ncbi:dTMP kinase [Fistulifera solaris]|uniref:Thymidylate kinase n=1 Tax=Fistulifera solaris TaxID=1519565 RepID=A0A1Z5K5E1_FISSO|nr:dTMP kinase [Fistulifera solaris]|eukprot:GAX21444.1 dTMP kinase [Fistulifera solaris]
MLPHSTAKPTRGAFFLLEGVDRCGKTTQCQRLLQRLLQAGIAATAMRFPNRTTSTGQLIDSYLQQTSNMDDRAIHLLFSANRWESADMIVEQLKAGTSIVCDRYAYSGVAFSASKDNMDLEWCQAPDRGLPAPDCVIFLDMSTEQAEERGGYGQERYEKREMQQRVRQRFQELSQLDDGVQWKFVNAAQTMDQVEDDIWSIAQQTLEQVQPEVRQLWQSGDYELRETSNDDNK